MINSKIKKLKNSKAFTLIELIVVIAVLGILVLLAAPKFLGYTAEAKLAQIKTDVKTYETALAAEIVGDDEFTKGWKKVEGIKLQEHRDNGKIFDETGLIDNTYSFNGEYYAVPEDLGIIKTGLKGDFYLDLDGNVYYYDEKVKVNTEIEKDKITSSEPKEEEPSKYEFTSEALFTWVEDSDGYYTAENPTKLGYYKYSGTDTETVVIPHTIKGTNMTSYHKMFFQAGNKVNKVVSTNPNITDVSMMFHVSFLSSIDLKEFNTSSITNTKEMFSYFFGKSIDITGWNTSKVTDMSGMFSNSDATSIIGVENLNTSKVTNMASMFTFSKVANLDLSKWDISKVTNKTSMFYNSSLQTGYAKASDLNFFNSGTGLTKDTFVTK